MKAIKDNKQYCIDESEKKRYADAGYDIVDDDGKVIMHGKGKTVSYDKYAEVLAENEALKAKLAESEVAESVAAESAEEVTTKKNGKKAGA